MVTRTSGSADTFTSKVGLLTLSLPIFIVLMAFFTVLNGVVIIPLWDWYVKPFFHLAGLNLKEAIGLSILVHYLTFQMVYKPREIDNSANYVILFTPIMALLIGYIVHLF